MRHCVQLGKWKGLTPISKDALLRNIGSNMQAYPGRAMHLLAETTRATGPSPGLFALKKNKGRDAIEVGEMDRAYTDEVLESIYHDLLSSESMPQPSFAIDEAKPLPPTDAEPITDILGLLEARFAGVRYTKAPSVTRLSSLLAQRHNIQEIKPTLNSPNEQPHWRVLRHITHIVEGTERLQTTVPTSSSSPGPSSAPAKYRLRVPLGIVSYKEWTELMKYCVKVNDGKGAERVLDLMIRSGMHPPPGLIEFTFDRFSRLGLIDDVERLLQLLKHYALPLTSPLRESHIQSYIRARDLSAACTLIHTYESLSQFPSQKTYTLLLSSLFHHSQNTPQNRALAWDMFAHMRYVAHPNPDGELWTTMIRACADRGDALRALDLWTEMKSDTTRKIKVGKEMYNWVILACARASSSSDTDNDFSGEAFRLAKELFSLYRETGDVSLCPDVGTFNALLESVKRTQDITRARWILAELIKLGETEGGRWRVKIDEEVMANLFQVYAATKGAFRRGNVKVVHGVGESGGNPTDNDHPSVLSSTTPTPPPLPSPPSSSVPMPFSPPQTSSEILAEARLLFSLFPAPTPAPSTATSAFSHVKYTPNLLNSYLSVTLAHASSFSDIVKAYDEHSHKNDRTFLLTLQRCSIGPRARDIDAERVLFARRVWNEWRDGGGEITFGTKMWAFKYAKKKETKARTIEQMWSAMVRVLTSAEEFDQALSLVKEFASIHPPSAILSSSSPSHSQKPHLTNRTYLSNISKPLVRLSIPSQIADADIPPHLRFSDIELLHHRLVARGRTKDVGYLTWLCKAYDGRLRTRRREVLGLAGAKKMSGGGKGGKEVIPLYD